MLAIVAVVSIVSGAINCFFGYFLFELMLFIVGFLIGAPIGGLVALGLSDGNAALGVLGAILGGILGGSLMQFLHFLGVFLLGAILGGLLGIAFTGGLEAGPIPAVVLLLAVFGGILALFLEKLIIILATSFSGAWFIMYGIFYFARQKFDPIDLYERFNGLPPLGYIGMIEDFYKPREGRLAAQLILWLLLGIVGVLIQYKFGWKRRNLPRRKQRKSLHWILQHYLAKLDGKEKQSASGSPPIFRAENERHVRAADNKPELTVITCPKCGYANERRLRFCSKCFTLL